MARIRRHRRDTVQSPLETYLREINEMALLTADEEKELAHRIAVGDKLARDRMVRANLRLVVNIARGYIGKGLVAPGPDRGGKPRPAARRSRFRSGGRDPVQHLRQLLDQAVDQARPGQHGQADPDPGLHGRAPVQVAADGRRPAGSAGRPPSIEEIAKALKLPKKKLAIVKKAIKVYNLVPQTDQPENGWSLGEMLMDERTRTPDVAMVEADNLRLVLRPPRRDGQARGDRPADAVRAQRRAAQDAQRDRRVAGPDPRTRPPDRERGARQAVGVAAGGLRRFSIFRVKKTRQRFSRRDQCWPVRPFERVKRLRSRQISSPAPHVSRVSQDSRLGHGGRHALLLGPEVRHRHFAGEVRGELAVERAVGLGNDAQVGLGAEGFSQLASGDRHIEVEDFRLPFLRVAVDPRAECRWRPFQQQTLVGLIADHDLAANLELVERALHQVGRCGRASSASDWVKCPVQLRQHAEHVFG